jgi:hypothetical protein
MNGFFAAMRFDMPSRVFNAMEMVREQTGAGMAALMESVMS